jgi:hypothetical protein
MLSTTTTTTPTAVLQECAIFAYQNGLETPWKPFYEAAMKKIAGTPTGASSNARTPRARVRKPTGTGVRRRGRPPATVGAVRATSTGGKVNTEQVIAKIQQQPGRTLAQLLPEFPGVRPNNLGRIISNAKKKTKTRAAAIEKRGTGKEATYYIAPGYAPAAMAA